MKTFKDINSLEEGITTAISEIIRSAIQMYGSAHILLSGGTTPLVVYERLAKEDIDWSKVLMGLVDERYVPLDHPKNNERALREAFGQEVCSKARFIGMVLDEKDAEHNLSVVSVEYQPFMDRTDFILLGMGKDGHFASLFPNDDASEVDLRSEAIKILCTTAPEFPTERISCSKGMLKQAKYATLMITGSEKETLFNESKESGLPVGYLQREFSQLTVFYAP
jgi:6-phosphogluconolactonase